MISVVIPSYNRAHILGLTIPTYCENEYVEEVIVVNDCSTDNTIEVLAQLAKDFPKIKYINLPVNQKQAAAKNHGINIAMGKYIYFGDDDSFLLPYTIDKLISYMNVYDIIGIRALYCVDEYDYTHLDSFIARQDKVVDRFFNKNTLEISYQMKLDTVIDVVFCQACFLIKTDNARKIMFDPNYLGNGYREETDFLIRARHLGLKIGYNTGLAQINLPRSMASGGAHSGSTLSFYLGMFKNNYYFLTKNKVAIRELVNLKGPVIWWQFKFILSRVLGKIIKQFKKK